MSQVLFHKLNNSRYVEYIDLKVVLRILVKKCLDKTYFVKNVIHVLIILFHKLSNIMYVKYMDGKESAKKLCKKVVLQVPWVFS